MVLLDRLTWGINASSAAHLQAVGAERGPSNCVRAQRIFTGAHSAELGLV